MKLFKQLEAIFSSFTRPLIKVKILESLTGDVVYFTFFLINISCSVFRTKKLSNEKVTFIFNIDYPSFVKFS